MDISFPEKSQCHFIKSVSMGHGPHSRALWLLSVILWEIAESHVSRIDEKQPPRQPANKEKLTASEPRDNAYDG